MKRFLHFSGIPHEPDGGWGDFVGSHDTLESAVLSAEQEVSNAGENWWGWWHIVDLQSEQIVASGPGASE